MERKKFLKGLGVMSVGTLIPAKLLAEIPGDEPSNQDVLGDCDTMPEETAGPYPTPSSVSTSSLVRSDITEGTQTGVPLTLNLTIENHDADCAVVSGLRVDIWQCNKRGYYSAYSGQPGIDGTVDTTGETWLRGIQYTDSDGKVTFTSIYPGWYTPRATHIHVQVYDGTTLKCTTQLAFPDILNTTMNAYYNTSGTNSVTNETDMVFSDSIEYELIDNVTGNTTDGYIANKTLGVALGNSTGIWDVDPNTGGQFSNVALYPNPVYSEAELSFQLVQAATVKVAIHDINGREIFSKDYGKLSAGVNSQSVPFSGIASGTYFLTLHVSNQSGMFKQTKKIVKN